MARKFLTLFQFRHLGGSSRFSDLRHRFEPVQEPPPPRKERIQSSIDAPAPELSDQAKSARVTSISRVEAELKSQQINRYVPKIGPTDSDEVRDLKRAIQAKEQEIVEMSAKLASFAERLDRSIDLFTASVVEVALEAAPAKPREDRVKAFQHSSHTTPSDENVNEPKSSASSSASSGGTSLAAILAAARSGQPRVQSERPKYAKLLRDLK